MQCVPCFFTPSLDAILDASGSECKTCRTGPGWVLSSVSPSPDRTHVHNAEDWSSQMPRPHAWSLVLRVWQRIASIFYQSWKQKTKGQTLYCGAEHHLTFRLTRSIAIVMQTLAELSVSQGKSNAEINARPAPPHQDSLNYWTQNPETMIPVSKPLLRGKKTFCEKINCFSFPIPNYGMLGRCLSQSTISYLFN